MKTGRPTVLILGTRGIPAAHGGFETFAERLALFLVNRGWRVAVYCQDEVPSVTQRFRRTTWQGIEQIHVQVGSSGPAGTLEFDAMCVRHAAGEDGVCLVLGYNGAMFLPYLRVRGRKIMINMDGIEWRRPKWGVAARFWFRVNEWVAAWTAQRLVADHPAIADHLATRRPRRAIATIPYGADPVTSAPTDPVTALGLVPDQYLVSIARIEPDNNILPIVEAFSRQRRGAQLAILGRLDPGNPYHRKVREAASDEVVFPGAIYDAQTVQALRFHARAYLHGHIVGGTNPSLVEALSAGSAVIAHRNVYNLWTAGSDQLFFDDADTLDAAITTVLSDEVGVARSRQAARQQSARFRWSDILETYESELMTLGGHEPVDVPVPNVAVAGASARQAVG